MALEDIENLKEKLAKNPDSKLFVPLAEEYRKADMFDEAIEVLKNGLELQPSYMSARVALGRIYLEKGMLNEAKVEYEEVIKAIPDNLFANKKLAEIYRELGDPGMAIKQYEEVLKLNPRDDEASEAIDSLASAAAVQALEETSVDKKLSVGEMSSEGEQPAVEEAPLAVEEAGSGKEDVIDVHTDQDLAEEPVIMTESASKEEAAYESEVPDAGENAGKGEEINEEEMGEEFQQFKSAIRSDVKPSDMPSGVDATVSVKFESDETPMFYAEESKVESSREDFEIRNREHVLPGEEEFFDKRKEEGEERRDIGAELPQNEEMVEQESIKENEPDMQTRLSHDEEVIRGPEIKDERESDIKTELLRVGELVGQSRFSEALKCYNELIIKYPDDKKIVQELQELRAYLKMLGKDKEEVIVRLEQLLSGIQSIKERR